MITPKQFCSVENKETQKHVPDVGQIKEAENWLSQFTGSHNRWTGDPIYSSLEELTPMSNALLYAIAFFLESEQRKIPSDRILGDWIFEAIIELYATGPKDDVQTLFAILAIPREFCWQLGSKNTLNDWLPGKILQRYSRQEIAGQLNLLKGVRKNRLLYTNLLTELILQETDPVKKEEYKSLAGETEIITYERPIILPPAADERVQKRAHSDSPFFITEKEKILTNPLKYDSSFSYYGNAEIRIFNCAGGMPDIPNLHEVFAPFMKEYYCEKQIRTWPLEPDVIWDELYSWVKDDVGYGWERDEVANRKITWIILHHLFHQDCKTLDTKFLAERIRKSVWLNPGVPSDNWRYYRGMVLCVVDVENSRAGIFADQGFDP
jgi:hypothetical protein